MSTHTAGWRTKNGYVNVNSLWLLAATQPTGVAAQLVMRWVAMLRFLGSNPGR